MQNKKKFIYHEILASTLKAGFMVRGRNGKNKIYNPEYSNKDMDEKKEKMRHDIRQCLVDIGLRYRDDDIDHKKHIDNILELKNEIQGNHAIILFEKTFRFGVAQKLLNVYLKYLWALDWINSTPPDCPIDGKISRELNSNYKFAKSDNIGEYEEVIKKAKQVAEIKNQSIVEWEFNTFLEENYSQLDFSKVD